VDGTVRNKLLAQQLELAESAARVLDESRVRVGATLDAASHGVQLSIEQRESCEALTSRFGRLCDLLVQRLFRTFDQIELSDEGTILDRLARAEKRGFIPSVEQWRELRELRNSIAHDYLIEASDRVLIEAQRRSPELLDAVEKSRSYAKAKGYVVVTETS
jgi:hypothetical protein